jgi:hypothetical protein
MLRNLSCTHLPSRVKLLRDRRPEPCGDVAENVGEASVILPTIRFGIGHRMWLRSGVACTRPGALSIVLSLLTAFSRHVSHPAPLRRS